jgi:hypothetical protein
MPYADPTKQREYQAKRYQSAEYKRKERERWNSRPAKPLRPFIGIDGEGGNINGRHEYLLLRVGTHLLYRNSKPLRTVDILRWLTSLPNEGIYVGYGFDYDVSMILRDWPQEKLKALFDRDSRKTEDGKGYIPVGHAGFLVEYLPRKHFRVSRFVKSEERKWFTVHDTIGFYQSSFVQALEAWAIGTPEEREAIRAMKLKRSDFTEATEDEIEYNRRECVMLAELLEALRDATREAGYKIANYEGAGCLAQAMLTKHEAPRRTDLPDELALAARAAYYGGRFEISRIGTVKPVHEYDLASAYPWAMANLPCLEHGQWINEYVPGNRVSVQKVAFTTARPWGPFPYRDPDGVILYPWCGQGWYWACEVDAARDAGDAVIIDDAWSFVSNCDHTPFSWIPDVYAERQRIGKGSKGKILKLGMNSLYGKMAQSVGQPRFANSVYAGMITAEVRAVMSRVCAEHGDNVVMIATDGIYLTEKMRGADRPIAEPGEKPALGSWEHQPFKDLFLVKPGIYFTSDGVKVKTRGVPRWQLDEKRDEIVNEWRRNKMAGKVVITRTQFIGARMATMQNAPEKLGQWIPTEIALSYESNENKRAFRASGRSTLHPRSEMSTPYSKHFGQEIALEALWEDLDILEQ